MKNLLYRINYYLLRALIFPLSYLPLPIIHKLAKGIGFLVYYCCPRIRKRCLSNLSLATSLNLDEKQIKMIAKASIQNTAIVCLEYPFISRLKDLSSVVTCINPDIPQKLNQEKKGYLGLCSHQANWEYFSLDAMRRTQGIAIARPLKNPYLCAWIKRIRESSGGNIVESKGAVKKSLATLASGAFVGIVADQGFVDEGIETTFFGRRAWTSPAGALLAYKTGSPIFVATMQRLSGHYFIEYSPLFWPDQSKPRDEECKRLTNLVLNHLEKSIQKKPEQWLWVHNRWKQDHARVVHKRFRHDSIAILLEDKTTFTHLNILRKIYPKAFFTVFVPKKWASKIDLQDIELVPYRLNQELYRKDYRFKMVINLTRDKKLKKHYKSLSAQEVLDLDDLKKLSNVKGSLSDTLKFALCKNPKNL